MNQNDPILPNENDDSTMTQEPADQAEQSAPEGEVRHYVTNPPPRKMRQVPLAMAIASVLTVCILTVLVTFALTTKYMNHQPDAVINNGHGAAETSPFSEIDVIDQMFSSLTIKDLDRDALLLGVLNGYIEATGDRYAQYFTAEELNEQQSDQNGELCGIGITVTMRTVEYQGKTHTVLLVTDVYDTSPAEKAGLKPGDQIIRVGEGADAEWVTDIGYNTAISRIQGEEGTDVFFTAIRKDNGTGEADVYTELTMKATRAKLTVPSVKARVCETNRKIGIMTVSRFNNTTPGQFCDAVEALRSEGCDRFILDLRGNPGGLLTSVEDLLTLFLDPGSVMLYSRNNKGEKTTYAITVNGDKVTSGSKTLTASDIGKFKGLRMTVLVNGDTASAAELFTANVMHYRLGMVVGTKTFGKGTMQTTYPLSYYGYPGALKLTTQYYDPPSGLNYDGIGLTPDMLVELPQELQDVLLPLLPESQDVQLLEAAALLSD